MTTRPMVKAMMMTQLTLKNPMVKISNARPPPAAPPPKRRKRMHSFPCVILYCDSAYFMRVKTINGVGVLRNLKVSMIVKPHCFFRNSTGDENEVLVQLAFKFKFK